MSICSPVYRWDQKQNNWKSKNQEIYSAGSNHYSSIDRVRRNLVHRPKIWTTQPSKCRHRQVVSLSQSQLWGSQVISTFKITTLLGKVLVESAGDITQPAIIKWVASKTSIRRKVCNSYWMVWRSITLRTVCSVLKTEDIVTNRLCSRTFSRQVTESSKLKGCLLSHLLHLARWGLSTLKL